MSRRMQNRIMSLWIGGWDPPAIARAVGRSEGYVADVLGAVRDRVGAKTARRIRKLRETKVHERNIARQQLVRVPVAASGDPVINFEVQAMSALRQRDETIRGYLARGVPAVELALSFGLHPDTVKRIGRES